MTPVALLVAFCTAMTVVAVGRLALADERDPVDVGSTLVVGGVTLLTALWASLAGEWLDAPAPRLALGLAGGGLVCLGAVAIVRFWDDGSADPRRGRSTEDGEPIVGHDGDEEDRRL